MQSTVGAVVSVTGSTTHTRSHSWTNDELPRRYRRTACVTPRASTCRFLGALSLPRYLDTTSLVRPHGHRALPAGVRPHAGAESQQPNQETKDRPHRRLPTRRPVDIDRVVRVLTSKTFVSRSRGVLTAMIRSAFDDIRPVTVPR